MSARCNSIGVVGKVVERPRKAWDSCWRCGASEERLRQYTLSTFG